MSLKAVALSLTLLLCSACIVLDCSAQESIQDSDAAAVSTSDEVLQAPPASNAANREPVPILPDANQTAWQREVWLIGIMFVMAIGCTGLAAAGFWMLSKNSSADHPKA